MADLIGRDFTSDSPGTKLVGDINYLRTRIIVGWAMADHMRASLVTGALAMAKDRGHLAPDAIFLSDRGTQWAPSVPETLSDSP
ncbi:hypothetical protein BJG92_03538 [Arthrobacter sp. SO5]|nr:hypothetical protein [Arthrobacter sp. SO5]